MGNADFQPYHQELSSLGNDKLSEYGVPAIHMLPQLSYKEGFRRQPLDHRGPRGREDDLLIAIHGYPIYSVISHVISQKIYVDINNTEAYY